MIWAICLLVLLAGHGSSVKLSPRPPSPARHYQVVVDSLFNLRKDLAGLIAQLRSLRDGGSAANANGRELGNIIRLAKAFQRQFNSAVRLLRQHESPSALPSIPASPTPTTTQAFSIPIIRTDSSKRQTLTCWFISGSGDGTKLARHAFGDVRGCAKADAVIGLRCSRSTDGTTLPPGSSGLAWRPVLCSAVRKTARKSWNPGYFPSPMPAERCIREDSALFKESEIDCRGPVLRQCRRFRADTGRRASLRWTTDVVGCHVCRNNPDLNTCCYYNGRFHPVGTTLCPASTPGATPNPDIYRCEADRLSSWQTARRWTHYNVSLGSVSDCRGIRREENDQAEISGKSSCGSLDKRYHRFTNEITTVWRYRRPSAELPCPHANQWYRLGHMRCEMFKTSVQKGINVVQTYTCVRAAKARQEAAQEVRRSVGQRAREYLQRRQHRWTKGWAPAVFCAKQSKQNDSGVTADEKPTVHECHDDETGVLYRPGATRCANGKVYRCRRASPKQRAHWTPERKRCVVCRPDPRDPAAMLGTTAYGTCCFHHNRFYNLGSHVCRNGQHLRCKRMRTAANSNRCEREWVEEGVC